MLGKKTIVNIVIASPSDTKNERDCIPNIFSQWNNANQDTHLQELMFETSGVPEMGDHPQHIINRQIVEKGDLLVAIFWSKIGTSTPTEKSGTIEEIKEFIKSKGPLRVMVYFCDRPLEQGPGEINHKEIETLQDFKNEIKSQCLYKNFKSTDDFRATLYPDIDTKVKQLLDQKLPIPGSNADDLSQDAWYDENHPDPRLRKPIDYGESFKEIAKNFLCKMDEFDRVGGATSDKFLDLAFHHYMSVAYAIEQGTIKWESELSFAIRTELKEFVLDLERFAESKTVEQFSEYFENGRKLADRLSVIVKKIKIGL